MSACTTTVAVKMWTIAGLLPLLACKASERVGHLLLDNLELGLLESKELKVKLAFSKPVRICLQK